METQTMRKSRSQLQLLTPTSNGRRSRSPSPSPLATLASEMVMGYQHQPLDPEQWEFRLLVFKREDIHDSRAPLKCTVRNVFLEGQLPDYHAISYTWGEDQNYDSEIIIDNRKAKIPTNAERALRRLTSHSKDVTDTTQDEICFWIDAICINQFDVQEKSQQLLLIGNIFSQAHEVLVWLGEDDDGMATQARSAVRTVVDLCKSETNDMNKLFHTLWSVDAKSISPRFSPRALPKFCNLAALKTLYSARWFQRIWILQETVAAQRATCLFGKVKIPLDEVMLAARWLWFRAYGRLFPEDPLQADHKNGIQNAATMYDMVTTPQLVPKTLSNLLLLGTRYNASDSRDKVYGILGLLNPDALDTSYANLLPDYLKPVENLYAAATRAVIYDTKSLFIMSFACRLVPPGRQSATEVDMPSWVPRYDWAYDPNRGSPSVIQGKSPVAGDKVEMNVRQMAGMPNVLSLQGFVIDELSHVASDSFHDMLSLDSIKVTVRSTWTLTTTHARTKFCGRLDEAYAATICAGRNKLVEEITMNADFRNNAAAFFSACGISSKLLRDRFQTWPREKDEHAPGNAQEFFMAVAQNSRNLKFFVTADGRIGMGANSAKQGDRICIVPGINVPVILRKEGMFWRYVGDAYVYGIMDGEYVRDLETPGAIDSGLQWFHVQ